MTISSAVGPIYSLMEWVPVAATSVIKWAGTKVDYYSPLIHSEVKNAWSYTSTLICLYGIVFNSVHV